MNKKGVEIAWQYVVLAVLALLVIIIMVMIIGGARGNFSSLTDLFKGFA